jgi:2-keto-3-deoxy-L-rhamnonate aldolase RhmA
MNNNPSRVLGIGTWLSIGSPVIAEVASECGFDWLLLDLEHGSFSESGVLACLQAAKRTGIRLIVRVGSLNPALISNLLDWGADGIMLPHVSSSEEAALCVRAMRYPPHGTRGFSSSARAFRYGLNAPKDMTTWTPPLFIAQIEGLEGVQNAEAIASVQGVDILFVGPADLKMDLSVRADAITYENALIRIAQAAQGHAKQAGILVRNPDDIALLRSAGFTCLALGSDLSYVRDGFLRALELVGT